MFSNLFGSKPLSLYSKKAKLTLLSLFLFVVFPSTLSAAPAPIESFVVMDFEDSELHDEAWLASQAEGYAGFYVTANKSTGSKGWGPDELTIAVGEGRGGSNALLVESKDAAAGLPGFFLIKAQSKNNQAARLTDANGYMLPQNLRANRFEFWLRFENGFRNSQTSNPNIFYPNHHNLHVGTYHFDPAKINGGANGGVVESDGWHFYHHVYLRHDKADDNWIHVVVNQQPQHMRTFSKSTPPNNPTQPAGNYFELLTRLYIVLTPYFSDPETGYPAKMWVDDIALSYVPEVPDVTIDLSGYSQGDTVKIQKGKATNFSVNITNNQAKQVSGVLSTNTFEKFNPKIDIGSFFKTISLNANETQTVNFSVTPEDFLATGLTIHSGLSFINDDEILSDSNSQNRSLSDSNVEKRWQTKTGPHDAVVSSHFIKLELASPTSNILPVAQAGVDQTVSDSDGNGNELIILDGSVSTDSDGTIISYVWKNDTNQIATGETATVTLAVGTHTITLTVTDNDGEANTDSITVIVESVSAKTDGDTNSGSGSFPKELMFILLLSVLLRRSLGIRINN